jgi:hypothetical protein
MGAELALRFEHEGGDALFRQGQGGGKSNNPSANNENVVLCYASHRHLSILKAMLLATLRFRCGSIQA